MTNEPTATLPEIAAKLKIGAFHRHVFLCIGDSCCTSEAGLAAWEALKKELKVHEDRIKDLMGEAVEGVDAKGNVLVRLPHRNRTTLVAKRVEKFLSAAQLAECQNVTSYRTLLYGA